MKSAPVNYDKARIEDLLESTQYESWLLGNYSGRFQSMRWNHAKRGCGGARSNVATRESKILAPCLCMVAQ